MHPGLSSVVPKGSSPFTLGAMFEEPMPRAVPPVLSSHSCSLSTPWSVRCGCAWLLTHPSYGPADPRLLSCLPGPSTLQNA